MTIRTEMIYQALIIGTVLGTLIGIEIMVIKDIILAKKEINKIQKENRA